MPKDMPTKIVLAVNEESVYNVRKAVNLQPERTDIDWYIPGSGQLEVYAYLSCSPASFIDRVYKKAKQIKE